MPNEDNTQNVAVTDIHMPFFSMVIFMVKWAIAAIPAFIILTVIGVVTWVTLGGLLHSWTVSKTAELIGTMGMARPTPEETTTPSAAESAYLGKILVTNVMVKPSVIGGKAVSGEVKNGGDRTLSRLNLTIYCLDKNGSPIFEESRSAVLAAGRYSEIFSEPVFTPLKPGYSRKFDYIIDNAPSEWSGKVEVKVTKIAFAEDTSRT